MSGPFQDGLYQNSTMLGGSGEGAIADITVANGFVTICDLTDFGMGYQINDKLTALLPLNPNSTVQLDFSDPLNSIYLSQG